MPSYYGVKDTFAVLIDAYNVVTALDGATVHTTAVMDTFHPLGAAFPTAINTGEKTGEFTATGILDSPTVDPISSVNGTPRVVSWLNAGNTVAAHAGPPFFGFEGAMVGGVEVVAADGAAHRLTPEFTISGNVHSGWILAPYAVYAGASGNTEAAYIDLGVARATATVFVHVTAQTLAGYTGLLVTLMHSTDHVVWNAHGQLSGQGLGFATGAKTFALTTTINQYIAFAYSYSGSGSSPSSTVFAGIAFD